MCLFEPLSRIPRDRCALVGEAGAVSYGALCDRVPPRLWLGGDAGDAASGPPAGAALWFRDPVRLIQALVALDGRCLRLLLIPADIDGPTAAALAQAAGLERVLTDQPAPADAAVRFLDMAQHEPADAAAIPTGRDVATAWLLITSGTTGTPKIVEHSFASLTRTIRARISDPPTRWGLLYPPARFAGIQVVLRSLLDAACLIAPPAHWSLPQRAAFLAAHGCAALSATPTLWRKLLMTPEAEALDLRVVTLGGEIADQAVLDAVRARWPAAKITHVFASTEAGAAFSVHDGKAGFPTAYLRDPPGGVELSVREGRLFVRNPLVGGRYLNRAEAFRGDDGFVDTGDMVAVDGERCWFLGRASGVINVGGDKVHPEEVEAVLLAHPSVRAARVFARKNPLTGALVAAEVALNDAEDPKAARAALLAWCRERLAGFKVPALLTITAELAVTAGGKLSRAAPTVQEGDPR